jgi:hypothetical protein
MKAGQEIPQHNFYREITTVVEVRYLAKYINNA